MKLAFLLFFVAVVFGYEAPKGLSFDVDVDGVFANKRLLDAYTKCFLDKGPCVGASREMKKHFTEIFKTNCVKCSKTQKKQVRAAFTKLKERNPEAFRQILEKYSPGEVHLQSFKKWLKATD